VNQLTWIHLLFFFFLYSYPFLGKTTPSQIIELKFKATPHVDFLSKSLIYSQLQSIQQLGKTDIRKTESLSPWLNSLVTQCKSQDGGLAFELFLLKEPTPSLTAWSPWCKYASHSWMNEALQYTKAISPETISKHHATKSFQLLLPWIQKMKPSKIEDPDMNNELTWLVTQLEGTLMPHPEGLLALFKFMLLIHPNHKILKDYLIYFEIHQIPLPIHPWRYYEILAAP
jgi:hypothetical protein